MVKSTKIGTHCSYSLRVRSVPS